MAVKIADVKLIPQHVYVGDDVFVEIKVYENTWESIMEGFLNWQGVRDSLKDWGEVKDY